MEYQLKADDFVGVTFWIISVSMVASTAFFFLKLTVFQSTGKLL